jgi:hypothetical protein
MHRERELAAFGFQAPPSSHATATATPLQSPGDFNGLNTLLTASSPSPTHEVPSPTPTSNLPVDSSTSMPSPTVLTSVSAPYYPRGITSVRRSGNEKAAQHLTSLPPTFFGCSECTNESIDTFLGSTTSQDHPITLLMPFPENSTHHGLTLLIHFPTLSHRILDVNAGPHQSPSFPL